ncbi:hypothetical protein V2J09_018353 [Rumex salicifolius]
MSEPRAKRPKIVRGEDDYLPGNITEIELQNFMTFNHLKCKPGPRLNLVIGPNGSGKSSIVCAIALGLGGDPQTLGRAASVGAYVKRGEESGYIRISLRGYSRDEKINITRKIDTNNKSEWLLNGKAVPKKDITDITQRFNIQINNLTQFLPQDRVCEFAKLTPVDLLRETEKAIGDPQLPIQHDALIQKSEELGRLQNAVERIRESLQQQKGLNAGIERDVERVRQRDELLTKADLMKKKLPWLIYDMKKAEYMEAKELEGDAKKKFDEAAKQLKYLKEPIEKQKQEKAILERESNKASNSLSENARRRRALQDDENHLGVQVQSIYNEIEDLIKQEESRQHRVLTAKQELTAAELELENLPSYEPPRSELEKLGAQIVELRASTHQVKQQKLEKDRLLAETRVNLRRVEDRFKDMENKNTKLLHALRNSGAERIFDAYNWLQANQGQLNKKVYGPVLLEVNVSNQSHAEYLEGQVSYYIWKSFITQDSGDRDLLVKNLRQFDVPILNYVPNDHYRPPPQISEEMRQLGIYSRLDQVFDAPAAVKEVLISQSGLDDSYIGSKETNQRADEVSKLNIFDFWTPENHYRWNRSRYGGHISASVDGVSKSRLLLCSSDGGELERLRSRKVELESTISDLEQSCKSLQIEQRHLENEEAKLQKQREEIINAVQHEKKKRKDIENRIMLKRRRLQSIQQEDDPKAVMSRLTDQISELNKQRYTHVKDVKQSLMEALALKWRFAASHLSATEMDAKIKEADYDAKQHEKSALQLSTSKLEVERRRSLLAEAKRNAESIAKITPDLEKAFLEMPTTIEDLEAAIQDISSQANSILFVNETVLADYERRQQQIEMLNKKLEEDERQLQQCLAEVDYLKGTWLPTLRNLVAQINVTFSRNFQEMAVAGEVSLDERDTDFRSYGILIKVKFRQTAQLQVLSAHHQSGGERSVSTILYLVSLQDLTNCPFRVVDEINQGMDPVNERKMFQQLVRASTQPNTPQCFLLTPKLLPDLEYSDECSILNIMNGPWIEQPAKVWSNGETWSTAVKLFQEVLQMIFALRVICNTIG